LKAWIANVERRNCAINGPLDRRHRSNGAETIALYLVTAYYGVRGSTEGEPAELKAVSAQVKLYTGAKVVKGFNHLGATALAADPVVVGGREVAPRSSVAMLG